LRVTRRSVVHILAAILAGCGSGNPARPDGALEAGPSDRMLVGDAPAVALAVDFTVSLCPSFAAGPRCTGKAPLTLEFTPISTGNITKYLWDFGDGTARSSESTPVHTYAFPGTYDVVLVGGGASGTASRQHPAFVAVLENGAGESCDVDQQCEKGLRCVCGSADKCVAAFVRGVCGSFCKDGCRPSEVCADLSLAMPTKPEPWQAPICVRPCQMDSDCGTSLRCRTLGAGGTVGWIRGCFPDYPIGLGGPCRSASGQLRNEVCVTGLCADLGVSGMCSIDCTRTPCPGEAACATMTDGRKLCLPRCGPTLGCQADPLIACTPPNSGPLGFTVMGEPVGSMFCAPKRCMTQEDCGLAGACRMDANGAHCTQ
jgi:PKD repeat protein